MTMIDADDDETTLPPLPDRPARPLPKQASAIGDFRTYETTFAASVTDDVFEVRLTSTRGYIAHFAINAALAASLAATLEHHLSQPYFRDRFLIRRPPPPDFEPLLAASTDVFFTAAEPPYVRLEQEPSGDRLVLMVHRPGASLHITMQVGVAIALYDVVCRAIPTTGK
jgi:hypothetical protein